MCDLHIVDGLNPNTDINVYKGKGLCIFPNIYNIVCTLVNNTCIKDKTIRIYLYIYTCIRT